ncbi:Cu(+)/Ag(+) sensor histidine kinase [uncultured Castellaniella sp.]|uniref:Cu(+)/Ag(+) sensor histidine kinase n=1 Tax=uncultured Castellaniella sp. TaxID=647907 RepID=UPI002601C78F|nr:Cu(+)/Ag(+) sensor histidine kinase [uncultured Castellaniella sp.]
MNRRPASLAVRLTASIGVVITAVLLVFGWTVERSISNHFVQQDVDELNAVVRTLRHALATIPPSIPPDALRERLANAVSGHHNAQFQISTSDGEVIYATSGPSLSQLEKGVRPVKTVTTDNVSVWRVNGETLRAAVVQVPSAVGPDAEPLTIVVATSIDFHLHYLERFHTNLWMLTAIVCLAAIFATWLAVLQRHAPIRRISREIRKIRTDQLHVRLDLQTVPAELTELVAAFNDMIGRLEALFQRLSDFSGDIAHELRTPITNLKTQTEVALSQPRDLEQYREILYSNLEEYDRMAKMVSDMLFLAQADNQLLKPEFATVDLNAEIQDLFDYFSAWAEEREVGLDLTGKPVRIQGDRLMIRRTLSNLLSNAIRYTPSGHRVTVNLTTADHQASVQVRNPGPIIPEEHLSRIFDRFYRLDASRQRSGEGAGLGLAIAKSIIEAHGGRIGAQSTTGATIFELSLPLVPCGDSQSPGGFVHQFNHFEPDRPET